MWYFSWVLGLGFAVTLAVLNAMWLEERACREQREKYEARQLPQREPPRRYLTVYFTLSVLRMKAATASCISFSDC